MAFLFQSNPDHWDLRGHMEPGKFVSWYVSRYTSLMQPGVLILLWEAKGAGPIKGKGLYGWGITTSGIMDDERGKQRIQLQYIERWRSKLDAGKQQMEALTAPIPAADVLSLRSWQNHLLNVMPAGTNFLVTPEQLTELNRLVSERYPRSQFYRAVKQDLSGASLEVKEFMIVPDLILEGEG